MAHEHLPHPLGFLWQKLATLGDRFTLTRYERALEALFAAAQHDPMIEVVVLTRQNDRVVLDGIRGGQRIKDKVEFLNILRPVIHELSKSNPLPVARP